MPLDFSSLIFRADKFSPAGEDQTKEAQAFRKSLKTQTLSDYVNNPSGGTMTKIVPEIFLAAPFKTTADDLIAHAPIAFLRQLQRAVESEKTPPFSPYEQALSNRFNSLFANRSVNRSESSDGAQAAHELILDRYLTFTHWTPTPTNWVHFINIGDWGNQVVERSSITEFIQYSNGTRQLPAGVPMANWLPIPPGPFNIMLRVYGPEGPVEDNTYVPPGIEKR
jgi:Protein of unknown function (DUF1214)